MTALPKSESDKNIEIVKQFYSSLKKHLHGPEFTLAMKQLSNF